MSSGEIKRLNAFEYCAISDFYDAMGWKFYSELFFRRLAAYLSKNEITLENHLDLACGTGILCCHMAEAGVHTYGIDISNHMLRVAKKNAESYNVEVDFKHGDMRDFKLDKQFDLVTCIFDSINHLMYLYEWKETFKCVYDHLVDGGLFIFDMNTLQTLSERWNGHYEYKDLNDNHISIDSIFHRPGYVDILVSGETSDGNGFIEKYQEASFPIEDVVEALHSIGFTDVLLFDQSFNQPYVFDSSERLMIISKK